MPKRAREGIATHFLIVASVLTLAHVGCSDSEVASGRDAGAAADARSSSDGSVGPGADAATEGPDAGEGGLVPSLGGHIDPDFVAGLPKDFEGQPTLFRGPPALGLGTAVIFSLGESADDPIGWWGACLSLALSCQDGDGFDRACTNRIPACAATAGGLDCCPQSCLDGMQQRLRSGTRGERILDDLLLGECFEGLASYIDEFGPMEEVLP